MNLRVKRYREADSCAMPEESPGYRPSPTLIFEAVCRCQSAEGREVRRETIRFPSFVFPAAAGDACVVRAVYCRAVTAGRLRARTRSLAYAPRLCDKSRARDE